MAGRRSRWRPRWRPRAMAALPRGAAARAGAWRVSVPGPRGRPHRRGPPARTGGRRTGAAALAGHRQPRAGEDLCGKRAKGGRKLAASRQSLSRCSFLGRRWRVWARPTPWRRLRTTSSSSGVAGRTGSRLARQAILARTSTQRSAPVALLESFWREFSCAVLVQ